MAPRLEGTAWEGTEGALQKQAATQRGGTSVLPASRDAAVVMSLARSHIWLPRSPRRTLVGKSGRARVPAGGAADRPQPARPGSSARTRTRPHAPTRAPHAPARARTHPHTEPPNTRRQLGGDADALRAVGAAHAETRRRGRGIYNVFCVKSHDGIDPNTVKVFPEERVRLGRHLHFFTLDLGFYHKHSISVTTVT